MRKTFKVVLIILFVLIGCKLFAGARDHSVTSPHIADTEMYGAFAVGLLETYKDFRNERINIDTEIVGVRVLHYAENQSIAFIGCTNEISKADISDDSENEYHWFRRIYFYEMDAGEWELEYVFLLDYESPYYSYSHTLLDWDFVDEREKEMIGGELPEQRHWECLYLVEEGN